MARTDGATALRLNVVGLMHFDTHERLGVEDCEGPCDDAGDIEGFWTGEQDVWGKLTIRPVDGGAPRYLFADEILEVEYPGEDATSSTPSVVIETLAGGVIDCAVNRDGGVR